MTTAAMAGYAYDQIDQARQNSNALAEFPLQTDRWRAERNRSGALDCL